MDLSSIAAIFSVVAGWINSIIGYFQAKKQAQTDQNTAVNNAITDHNNDGAQSVADTTSSALQNQEIDKEIDALKNAQPIQVTQPGGKT